jgi:hypothetical protein
LLTPLAINRTWSIAKLVDAALAICERLTGFRVRALARGWTKMPGSRACPQDVRLVFEADPGVN